MQDEALGLYPAPEGDVLVLRSEQTKYWFGAALAAASAVFLLASIAQATTHDAKFWTGIVIGTAMLARGVFLMLSGAIHTTFDVRARRVEYHKLLCGGLYERKRSYSFDEIEALFARESNEDGQFRYLPVLKVRNGPALPLACEYGGYRISEIIRAVCSATGLPALGL